MIRARIVELRVQESGPSEAVNLLCEASDLPWILIAWTENHSSGGPCTQNSPASCTHLVPELEEEIHAPTLNKTLLQIAHDYTKPLRSLFSISWPPRDSSSA